MTQQNCEPIFSELSSWISHVRCCHNTRCLRSLLPSQRNFLDLWKVDSFLSSFLTGLATFSVYSWISLSFATVEFNADDANLRPYTTLIYLSVGFFSLSLLVFSLLRGILTHFVRYDTANCCCCLITPMWSIGLLSLWFL